MISFKKNKGMILSTLFTKILDLFFLPYRGNYEKNERFASK